MLKKVKAAVVIKINIKEDISYDSSISKNLKLLGYVSVQDENTENSKPLLYIIHENKFFFKYNEKIIYELRPIYGKLEQPKTFMTSITKIIKDDKQLIFKINVLNNKFNKIKQSNESVFDFDITKYDETLTNYLQYRNVPINSFTNCCTCSTFLWSCYHCYCW